MIKQTVISIFEDISLEVEKFTYIDRLLYSFTFLFIKITLDTLDLKKEEYKKKYPSQPYIVQRLIEKQPINIKQDWNDIYNRVDYPELGYYINQYLQELEENNQCLKGIFSQIDFTKISYERLRNIIKELNSITLAIRNEDDSKELAEAMDEILLNSKLEGTLHKISAGNDFTPKDVAKLISQLINAKENEEVADLMCGSGGLLMQTVKEITNNKVQIYGQDKDKKILKLCRLNLLLHGIYDAIIKYGDTIDQNSFEKKFDVIVANPPFSTSNDIKNRMEEESSFLYSEMYSYGIPPVSRADYAFIQNMLYSLKNNGRMAIIIPLGALSRTGAEEKIRKNMIKDNVIDTIILLPSNLFRNTGIKTCIMLFSKSKMQSDILFIDASKEFEKGRLQNHFNNQNFKNILEAYKARKNINGFSYVASLDEVLKNDGNLSINKYVIYKKEDNINLEQLKLQINDIEEQLKILKDKKKFYEEKL